MKTLILGLGNPILGDDGAGLKAVALVRQRLLPDPAVEVDQERCGGLRLMERLIDYDRVILLDAICTGAHPPGTLLHLRPTDIASQHTASVHDVNLPTALRLAGMLGLKIPNDIRIIAIEVENTLDFSEQCTPAVAAALPRAVEAVLAELHSPEERP
jgi:hydrogenase maturation protease